MAQPLIDPQLALLAKAASSAVAATTLRAHSELRWLEHLGLVELGDDGRFAITADGLARLAGEAADSRIDA